jgi:hypothetical protein
MAPQYAEVAAGSAPGRVQPSLFIRHARLPAWLGWVSLRHVRVGAAEVDLHYKRSDEGTLVTLTRKRGDLRVSVEC